MKNRILILTAVTLFLPCAQGATISNFSISADEFYGGFRVRFNLDPIDAVTLTGVDSILFSFTGISSPSPLFSSPIEAFQDADWWGEGGYPSSTGFVEIIGPYSIILNTDLLNSSESLDFSFKGGIDESLMIAEDPGGVSTGITYGLDIILNPHQGSSPSSLAEQEFVEFATQDDFNYEYLGVPELSTSIFSIFGLGVIFARRDRKSTLAKSEWTPSF